MFRWLNQECTCKRRGLNASDIEASYDKWFFRCISFVLYFFDIPVNLNYLYPIYSQYFRNSHERRPFWDAVIPCNNSLNRMESMELANLNNKISDWYHLTLPLGSNNTNSFVYALLLLKSPSTRCCINFRSN